VTKQFKSASLLAICLCRNGGRKEEEVAGGWRKLHSEKLHNFYARVIKSRRIRWAGGVAGMG